MERGKRRYPTPQGEMEDRQVQMVEAAWMQFTQMRWMFELCLETVLTIAMGGRLE